MASYRAKSTRARMAENLRHDAEMLKRKPSKSAKTAYNFDHIPNLKKKRKNLPTRYVSMSVSIQIKDIDLDQMTSGITKIIHKFLINRYSLSDLHEYIRNLTNTEASPPVYFHLQEGKEIGRDQIPDDKALTLTTLHVVMLFCSVYDSVTKKTYNSHLASFIASLRAISPTIGKRFEKWYNTI